jgi:hypothetical protein
MPNLASGPQNQPRAKVAVSKFSEGFKSLTVLSVSTISPALYLYYSSPEFILLYIE